jgi:outer membrane lipoprotein carrier protein
MYLKTLLYIGLFCFISLSITAKSATAETAAQSLQQLLAPINTLSADFTQNIKDQDNNVYQRLTGNLILKKPNQLRWNVVTPTAQLIISDGERVWLYDPDLEQVIIQSFSANFKTNPISILLGNLNQLNADFTVNHITENSFSLVPKQKNALFAGIQLRFIDNILSRIDYQDNFGQNTQLTLSQVTLNPQLARTTFMFDIPQGVDIINHAR